MRFWPFRGRPVPPSADSSAFAIAELAPQLSGVLAVEQVRTEGHALAFGGRLLLSPEAAITSLQPRFRSFGYTPFLQASDGLTWVRALPFVEVEAPSRPRLNIILFVLTVLSTVVSGSGAFFDFNPFTEPLKLANGFPFAFTLLGILGTHEFGHYFTARHYGASVSLPYFIPAPPPFLFGTLGAIIRMRSPARDRNSLFDIAAAGPLAGLLVAVPALWIGLGWSKDGTLITAANRLLPANKIKTSDKVTITIRPPAGAATFEAGTQVALMLVYIRVTYDQIVDVTKMFAIDPATGAKTVIASNLDIGLAPYPGGPPALVPTGVAVGRTGTVYVSSDIRNALYKLTPPTPQP